MSAARARGTSGRRVVDGAARAAQGMDGGSQANVGEEQVSGEYAAMVAKVRAELLAVGPGRAGPTLDRAVERIVNVVGRFVLEWSEGRAPEVSRRPATSR